MALLRFLEARPVMRTASTGNERRDLGGEPDVGGRCRSMPVEQKIVTSSASQIARRTPDDDLQHGLEFGWRSADDLQNLGCRCLPFERLVSARG